MLILGIETSCDETSAAVVEADLGTSTKLAVRSNIIASQIELHRKTGGVVPEVAAREHVMKVLPVIEEALEVAGVAMARGGALRLDDIDAIAVTARPGLISSLLIGTSTANVLALLGKKPLIPVNHIEGHIAANWLDRDLVADPVIFPVVVLTVSGGHNELVLMRDTATFESLGSTRDDAAGEAFDKVARLIGLPYPGGPEISRLAKEGNPHGYPLPRALWNEGYDFSFSGLKSAVARLVEKEGDVLRRADLAASFQEAVCDVLSEKLVRAAVQYGAKEVHLAGGVSANRRLREMVEGKVKELGTGERDSSLRSESVRFPAKIEYCTDNAAMIAAAGYFQFQKNPEAYREWKNVEASTQFGF